MRLLNYLHMLLSLAARLKVSGGSSGAGVVPALPHTPRVCAPLWGSNRGCMQGRRGAGRKGKGVRGAGSAPWPRCPSRGVLRCSRCTKLVRAVMVPLTAPLLPDSNCKDFGLSVGNSALSEHPLNSDQMEALRFISLCFQPRSRTSCKALGFPAAPHVQ